MKKLLLLPVCVLVLCMTVPASFVFAEEELSSEVSCGGIITAIQRQGLLSSIPPLVFYSNEDSSTVAFRAKCKIFSHHLQKPILKTEKGRFKGL